MNEAGTFTAVAAAAPAVSAATGATCENCGNPVSQQFCGACGQRLEAPVHSLWHFSQVAAEDLTHADSRLWRTLWALLARPGYLTREFLHGRRARYMPPVRLYLVLSLAFFLLASASQTKLALLKFDDPGSPRRAAIVEVQPDAASPAANETAQQRQKRLCGNTNYNGPWEKVLQPAFRRACEKTVADDGHELQSAFLHNLPRAMFVFLPLLAGIMMLLYWRPRHYYVEHLLLLVHNHACVFLAIMVAWPVAKLLGRFSGPFQFAVFLYFAWYMFRSMRVAYGQGRALTVAKLAFLALCYLMFGALMLRWPVSTAP